jgi:hypothetical protein
MINTITPDQALTMMASNQPLTCVNELKIMILFLDLQLYGRTKSVFVYITDTAVGYARINSAKTGQGHHTLSRPCSGLWKMALKD